MKLIIRDLDVSQYIQNSGFSESLQKVYDTNNAFTASDGTEINPCLGVRKSYNISLNNVPLNVKNMLRSRSRYGYISCTIGDQEDSFMLEDFSAQVIIQNDTLNLWAVSFTLNAKSIISNESYQYGIYSISCEGVEYKMSENQIVGDITITNNAGGLPTDGICASQLSFSIDLTKYAGIPYISPSAECHVHGFSAPTYYVSSRSVSGNVLNVTATDRTVFLDLPFNYTSLTPDDDGNVATNNVLGAIGSQAGFKNGCEGNAIVEAIPKIPYADLATTCRSIITALAQAACGTWYCDAYDTLRFYGFGNWYNTLSFEPSDRTDIQEGVLYGPITGVLGINDSTDSGESERITSGAVSDALHTIKIQSKYVSQQCCDSVYRRVRDMTLQAFTLERCRLISYFFTIGSTLDFEGAYYTHMVTNATIYLSFSGSYASITGDMPSELEWDFSGALTQAVNQRIVENQKYHGVALSKKDGLTCEGVGSKIQMADGTLRFLYKDPAESSTAAANYVANKKE